MINCNGRRVITDLDENEINYLNLWFPGVAADISKEGVFSIELSKTLYLKKDKTRSVHLSGDPHRLTEIFGINRVYH